MITFIVAIDRNRAIGAGGRIPWRLPADLKRFRKLTMGHRVVMGRKTYESIGKPLSGRENIVVTRRADFQAPGCTVVHDLESALRDGFVIGGGELYAQALPRARKAYVTEVDTEVQGADTFFPELDSGWKLVEDESREADADNPFRCRFLTYER